MEKHENANSIDQDVEDIEVDVVSTATPSGSVTEVVDDDSSDKARHDETPDHTVEAGDGCPPDIVSSISDVHYDVAPLNCTDVDSTPKQSSKTDHSLTNHSELDHVISNCTSTNQEETSLQTPRRRSGSVGDTAATQSSGSHGDTRTGNPVDRNRSGSMSHVESRETGLSAFKPKKTTTNFRIIDIVQLPRPRNPGGILPQDNQPGHEALDLIVNEKRGKRTISQKESLSWTSTNDVIIPNSNLNQSRRHSDIGSYGITMTSAQSHSAWSSSINETVERPQPSSVVDNEGMAKKIARLDSSLCSNNGDDLWLGRVGLMPNVRTTSARTPPERPKVPRRQFSPLVPNSRTRQAVLSPGQQRGSPIHEISPTSETSRLSTGSISQSAIDVERMTPETGGRQSRGYSLYSPDDMVPVTSSRNHKCRFCNYSTTSYTQLQFHHAKHGGSIKALKCPLCDYMTNEKSNFRRHRRLHARGNSATILKCGKCSYATTLPYKIREHYHQVHNEVRIAGIPTDVPMPENGIYGPPQRLLGSRSMGSMTVHQNPCDTLAGQVPYLGYTPLMMNGHTNTYPYPPSNRQPGLSSLDPFMNSAYGVLRSRQEGQHAVSNYLRSVMPSAINSHSTPRQATSTLTSSDYFISPVVDTSHHVESLRGHRVIDNSSVSNTVQSSPDVKVKVEPIDVDNHSDVSSTATGYNTLTPDLTCHTAEAQPSHQTHVDSISTTVHHHGNLSRSALSSQRRNLQTLSLDDTNFSSGQGVVMSRNLDSVQESSSLQRPRPGLQRSRSCTDVNGSDAYNSFNSSLNSSFKFGSRSVGIQCILPIVKAETDLNGDYFHCQTFIGQQIRSKGVERGVQCNMNSASRSNLTRQQGPTNLRLSGDGSDLSEHHSSIGGESRCGHCGIVFEDEVMFSIHIGCHSHTDPFICNICGKHCGNKYGFYSHIMRGHHF